MRCTGWPPDCVDIPGEVSSNYRLTADDEEKRLRVRITATNGAGPTDAYCWDTYPIAPPRWSPPRPTEPPTPPPAEPRPPAPPGDPPPPPPGPRPGSPLPDLVATAFADPPPPTIPAANATVTYTITIGNGSDVYATGVSVTGSGYWNLANFVATTSASFDGSSCTTSTSSNTFTCDLRGMPAHTSKQITVTGIVTQRVYMTFGATVTSLQADANPADNSASIVHSGF